MKYKISDAYIDVNEESIKVGVVLGKKDKPTSLRRTEYITNSEYEAGLKDFKYGAAYIDDCVYHCVAKFVDLKAEKPVEKKWIDELEKMGYDTSRLIYELKE